MAVELPSDRVTSLQRRLASAAAVTTSPFSGGQQIQQWGGFWWEYEFNIGPYEEADARAIDGLLAGLEGSANTFLFADPTISTSVYFGDLEVSGDDQTGRSLAIDSCPPGARVFQTGQFFSLGGDETTQLYQLTADVVSDSLGAADMSFVPPLRNAPADQDLIEYRTPRVLLRLSAPVTTSIELGRFYRWTIQAREAL